MALQISSNQSGKLNSQSDILQAQYLNIGIQEQSVDIVKVILC